MVTMLPRTGTRQLHLIIDTISAPHDYNAYLGLLRHNGVMAIVGVPPKPAEVKAFSLIEGNKSLVGSSIGGSRETQEMLKFCAAHDIVSDIELILRSTPDDRVSSRNYLRATMFVDARDSFAVLRAPVPKIVPRAAR